MHVPWSRIPSALLKPGAFANVELQLKEIKNALMVPTQAIIPQELKKQLIVAKEGKAKFITVQTGVRQASAIQVLTGIAAGRHRRDHRHSFPETGNELKIFKSE